MNSWLLITLIIGCSVVASLLLLYPLKKHRICFILGSVATVVLINAGYFYWGGFSLYDAEVQKQESQKQAKTILATVKSPQALIAQLRAKLDDTPQSAKGWFLLGRLYLSQQNEQLAFEAFAKAAHFAPQNEEYVVHYAHSLWQLNKQQFNPQLITIFTDLLQRNPNQPDALAMLAMNAYKEHLYEQAIDYWQRLLQQMPAQSKEAVAIQQAIAKAQEQMNIKKTNKIK